MTGLSQDLNRGHSPEPEATYKVVTRRQIEHQEHPVPAGTSAEVRGDRKGSAPTSALPKGLPASPCRRTVPPSGL